MSVKQQYLVTLKDTDNEIKQVRVFCTSQEGYWEYVYNCVHNWEEPQ